MQSLYDKTDHWKTLEEEGYIHAAKVARMFTLAADMDRAIGLNNCVAAWHRGGRPSRLAERACELWLAANTTSDAVAAGNAADKADTAAVEANTETILVMCSPVVMKKVKAVLSLMSAEFVDL